MKICIFASDYCSNQTSANIILRNANIFAENGHDVVVIFSWIKEVPIDILSRVKIKALPAFLTVFFPFAGFNPVEVIYRLFIVLIGKYDVVFSYTGHRPAAFIPSMLARLCRGSVIVTEWWEWFGKGGYAELRKGLARIAGFYDSVFEITLLSKYDAVIAISQGLADRLPNSRNVEVLNGASDSQLKDYDKTLTRQELDLPEDAVILGMSGSASNDESDCANFYEAYLELEMKYPRLYLLASGNPDYLESLRRRMEFKNFIAIGWPSYSVYNKYMSACDAFVLPYPPTNRNIGRWPNKFGDFMRLSRPLITNSTGDFKDYFSKYKIGYICNNYKEEYCGLLNDLLRGNKLKKFEKNDFQFVFEKLSFENRNGLILKLFYSLINDKQ